MGAVLTKCIGGATPPVLTKKRKLYKSSKRIPTGSKRRRRRLLRKEANMRGSKIKSSTQNRNAGH